MIREVASVTVPTARGGYPVRIGTGLVDRLDQLLPAFPGAEAAAVVSCGPVAEAAGRAGQALGRRGLAVHQLEVPAGEEAKRLEVVAGLYERLAAIPTRRADPVVAVGGGATTDVAGFAAATWLRGVPLVNLPTTVLGMVDAAVGGKTGVDVPAGKNLVGAFHQPVAVVADLDTLAGLPAAEVRSGLAEVAKAGLVGDPALAEALARAAGLAVAADPVALAPLVEGAVRVKAAAVAADEHEEAGDALGRLSLNYGHTLGHALERLGGYRGIRHGEAVALGMVFAARVAEAVGLARPGLADGHVELLAALGLPVGGVRLDPDQVLAAMATDKKHRQGLRLVLLRRPGEPEVVAAPDRRVLVAAIRSLAGGVWGTAGVVPRWMEESR
ncbi:MAG TPA: 3-dehydroquinate synthase family protein [Actinomycetes bacterium]|nr:3-dehydroquinate synthase family protein [Actinomycetes bacterium]